MSDFTMNVKKKYQNFYYVSCSMFTTLFLMPWDFLYCNYGEAFPETGHGDPQGCETPRLPHFLDCRITDEVSILTCRQQINSRKIPHTYFCQRLNRPKSKEYGWND